MYPPFHPKKIDAVKIHKKKFFFFIKIRDICIRLRRFTVAWALKPRRVYCFPGAKARQRRGRRSGESSAARTFPAGGRSGLEVVSSVPVLHEYSLRYAYMRDEGSTMNTRPFAPGDAIPPQSDRLGPFPPRRPLPAATSNFAARRTFLLHPRAAPRPARAPTSVQINNENKPRARPRAFRQLDSRHTV